MAAIDPIHTYIKQRPVTVVNATNRKYVQDMEIQHAAIEIYI